MGLLGSANFVLDAYDYLSWDLSNSQQRSDFASFCNNYYYVEGATDTLEGELTFTYYCSGEIHRDRIEYTYVAADCGDQPTTYLEDIYYMNQTRTQWVLWLGYRQKDRIHSLYSVIGCEYSITDNLSARPGSGGKRCTIPEYNCIAWSVDEDNAWYEATYIAANYGDKDGVFELADMDDFYYKKKGWTPITTGTDEEKAEEAETMYYSNFHAARRSSCSCGAGKWIMYESKCGQWRRMEHVWDHLNGSDYGTPIRFYK